MLFKAGRYVEAQDAAARALDAWNKSGLGGEGTALRVRAEALEALGRRDAAIAVVEDAIGALQPLQQVNHLLAAYKCAHRLTGKPEYLERAKYLQGALQKVDRSPPSSRLTPRERQIAQLVSEGSSNKAIAVLLGLSHRTVENHVAAIFGRLGIRARWQLTPDVLRAMPGNGVAGASSGHES
jgi:DNA-binding NarL/FixJ family response regulator